MQKINERREKKALPLWYLFLVFFFSFFYMESLLQLFSIGRLFSIGLFYSLFVAFSLSAVLYVIVAKLTKKQRGWFLGIFYAVLLILYIGQLVYYKILDTFATVYSIRHGGQAVEFWQEAVWGIANNFLPIILLVLPVPVIVYLSLKLEKEEPLEKKYLAIGIIIGVIVHLLMLGTLYLHQDGEHSPYHLYHNVNAPIKSVGNLGLINYMRLDIKRNITDWSPAFIGELPVFKDDTEKKKPTNNELVEKRPDLDESLEPEPEPEPQANTYNKLDIDFTELINEEENSEIKEIHKYFQWIPATAQNEYTGRYEGYNLIFITAEAFSHLALHEEVTPTLYRLVHEGYHFTNFYTPLWGVSTSDGEYVATTGLIPKSGVWSFRESATNHLPFVTGNQLKELGYLTKAYHNHRYTYYYRHLSHPNMGYEYKGIGNGLEITEAWPRSDLEMMEVTLPEYIDEEPFHSYYMTVSGHLRYNFTGNHMALKNRSVVEHLPYSESVRAYLATQVELDRALEHLLNKLDDKGIAERTLIVMSSDHYPYGLTREEIEELEGSSIDNNFDLYRNALVIYTKGMESMKIDEPAFSLDILPTISNLMGLEYDSRLMMGRDLFSDEKPLVFLNDRSFITDKGMYISATNEFIPHEGVEVLEDYQETLSNKIRAKFHFSARILDYDYYRIIMKHLGNEF